MNHRPWEQNRFLNSLFLKFSWQNESPNSISASWKTDCVFYGSFFILRLLNNGSPWADKTFQLYQFMKKTMTTKSKTMGAITVMMWWRFLGANSCWEIGVDSGKLSNNINTHTWSESWPDKTQGDGGTRNTGDKRGDRGHTSPRLSLILLPLFAEGKE